MLTRKGTPVITYKCTFVFEDVFLIFEMRSEEGVEEACEKLAVKMGARYLYSDKIDPTTGKPE